MPFRHCSSSSMISLVAFLILMTLRLVAASGVSFNGASMATYWGQHRGEGTLAKTCATGNYRYINIAFLTTFGGGRDPVLDLSGHCDASRGGCAGLRRDIRYCQKWGIKIMLSLGGEKGRQSLNSTEDAGQLADYLYHAFLGGSKKKTSPFGGAVLDGIDFSVVGRDKRDLLHWEDLAAALASRSSPERRVFLTAAPQCAYPDATLRRAVATGVFDVVWVRFFNQTSCQYAAAAADGLGPLVQSWARWNADPGVNVAFMGLPASGEAAASGYVPPGIFTSDVLPLISKFDKYGGIMLWDRYHDRKSRYSDKVRLAVTAPAASSAAI